jgi:hypothetical protein
MPLTHTLVSAAASQRGCRPYTADLFWILWVTAIAASLLALGVAAVDAWVPFPQQFHIDGRS